VEVNQQAPLTPEDDGPFTTADIAYWRDQVESRSVSVDIPWKDGDVVRMVRRWLATLDRHAAESLDVAKVLPPATVCACLDETGERHVTRWERCERCRAFMESDTEPIDAASPHTKDQAAAASSASPDRDRLAGLLHHANVGCFGGFLAGQCWPDHENHRLAADRLFAAGVRLSPDAPQPAVDQDFASFGGDLATHDSDALREAVARAIYDAMRVNDSEGRDRPWVRGGNSLKQEEARRRARAALAEALVTPAGDEHSCADHDETLDEAYRKGLADAQPPQPDSDSAALLRQALLRQALEPCFAERSDCPHGAWEAISGDHYGEHLRAVTAALQSAPDSQPEEGR
jgi:hypothetical protein